MPIVEAQGLCKTYRVYQKQLQAREVHSRSHNQTRSQGALLSYSRSHTREQSDPDPPILEAFSLKTHYAGIERHPGPPKPTK